jgi:hypothetical protein
MVDQASEDDFLLLCSEFGLNDGRRRGLLWHALCRARAIGSMQVCISLRQLIGQPHPVLRRPMTLGEVHQAVKFYQEHSRKDMQQWHDLPEQYKAFEQATHPDTCGCDACLPNGEHGDTCKCGKCNPSFVRDVRLTQGYQDGRELGKHLMRAVAEELKKIQQEGAGDGTGEAPAVCERAEPTAPACGGVEAGECRSSDDAETCG